MSCRTVPPAITLLRWVNPQGNDRAGNRDGVLHYFYLTDLVKGRGLRKVSVYRGGPRDFYASSVAAFDPRIDMVLLNTLSRHTHSEPYPV